MVIWRGWVSHLFGFDYRLECYTPAAKRRHGYFCLPVLWGSEFVGRLDPKADRKARTFIVRRLTLEPGCTEYDELLPALAGKLHEFAAFNGCDRIVVEATHPRGVAAPLKRALADGP